MTKIDERFVVNLKGKQFVTYEGLLDVAHKEGLISIEVDLLQVPTKENNMTAIAKATAKTKEKTFTDIGDASPKSVNSQIQSHIIRMASTRAKARALRDLTNIGMTAFEELAESDEIVGNEDGNNQATKGSRLICTSCGTEIKQGVAAYSKKHFGRELCMNCQKQF